MTYTAILEEANDGRIWAHIPEIDGVAGAGMTREEAISDLKHGVELWLEVEGLEFSALPKPSTIGTASVTIG
jgi:predicted RNase H-like HicB family nuclease